MAYFLMVNNCRNVWDFKAWKKDGFPTRYWRFDDDDYRAATENDTVFHYVTSARKSLQGIHLCGKIKSKEEREVLPDYWLSGKAPKHKIKIVNFEITEEKFPHIEMDRLSKAIPAFGKMLMGCQGRSSRQLSISDGLKLARFF